MTTAAAPAAGTRWPLWGGEAHLLVTDPDALAPAHDIVTAELAAVDAVASRFRPDSELSLLNASPDRPAVLSPLLAELLAAALRAARDTDGAVDPTVGPALVSLGYDRDVAAVAADGPPVRPTTVAGWRAVGFDRDRRVVRLPPGVELDLGATAKAQAADRAAAAVVRRLGGGVLVNLAGDLAVAGEATDPAGWVVRVTDDHRRPEGPGQNVAVRAGGLATSSTTVRRWRRGGVRVHHLVDPLTGLPVQSRWRTVSVCAASCLAANVAATAAIVKGDAGPEWLADRGLPARLVRRDGGVVTVAGWPEEPA